MAEVCLPSTDQQENAGRFFFKGCLGHEQNTQTVLGNSIWKDTNIKTKTWPSKIQNFKAASLPFLHTA
jgi:hypothetical protein